MNVLNFLHSVAKNLKYPNTEWTSVCPTPHSMACVLFILKLEVLYTKRIAAELTTPRVKGITSPVNRMVRE